LKDYRDFEYNDVEGSYKDLPTFIDELHAKDKRYVPILDAAIAARAGGDYEAYNDAINKDIFVKTESGEVYTGRVWPSDAAFPDFFKDSASAYW